MNVISRLMRSLMMLTVPLVLLLLSMPCAQAVSLLLPLGRTAYQTNEWIDLSVVRSRAANLPAGELQLVAVHEDGSRLRFTFPLNAVAAVNGTARTTEHLHLNGFLLRPGRYRLQVQADGEDAATQIELYSHMRKTPFKLIDWASRAVGSDQAVLGEESLGFNLNFAAYGGMSADDMIRGGTDFMWCCTMSGGAQMDLRRECDWSDPYVLGGGVARMADRALQDRTRPNCLGEHIYDEPTLTSWKHPAGTGQNTPFNVPAQDRAFKAAFAEDPIQFNAVDANNPQDIERFKRMNYWRFSILDAAWKLSAYTVSKVRPDFISANQGSWLFSGFGVGYYFNYQRSLPVYSGHGGYDYLIGANFAPSFFYEFGRMRQENKPQWYLPTWYQSDNDLYRCEQYLSFQSNLQGMAKPPDSLAHRPSKGPGITGIVESNKLMARLGTIFTTMPVTRPPVAVLYSISHNLHAVALDKSDTYYGDGQFHKLLNVYIATKQLQVPIDVVVEEDILDGTLAANNRVLIIAGANDLDARVIRSLETFITRGGAVLLSDDSRVRITGSIAYAIPADFLTLGKSWDAWARAGQWDNWNTAWMKCDAFTLCRPLAKILGEKFAKLGITPAFTCDRDGVIASQQAWGDIEYLFAVNAVPDVENQAWIRAAQATITLPDDGRPVYDAVNGGLAPEFKKAGGKLAGLFRFGAGQLRVFARTARPIGGVQVATPVVYQELTTPLSAPRVDGPAPIRVEFTTILADVNQRILCGSAPLQIVVTDPLKVTRYDLFRATDKGLATVSLPLAANDPAGAWTITVRELLSGREGVATFQYSPIAQCGAIAGATARAVYFQPDHEQIFRFFRANKELNLVVGANAIDRKAAERIAETFKPWDIRCTIIAAADVKKRELSDEMKPTWVGLRGGRDADYALEKATILIGMPQDNPLIDYLARGNYLPYPVTPGQFPGAGRGYLAWQTDVLRFFNVESLTVIAEDEAGMSEAVGTLYQIMTGFDPLTQWNLPSSAEAETANRLPAITPEIAASWHAQLPDRILDMKVIASGEIFALSNDGTIARIAAGGKARWQRGFGESRKWAFDVAKDGSLLALATTNGLTLIDGNGKTLTTQTLSDWKFSPIATAVTISPDASKVLVASGYNLYINSWHWSGKLVLFTRDGKRLWELGGDDPNDPKKTLVPKEVKFACFTPDGAKLLLVNSDGADVRNVRDGSISTTLAEVQPTFAPQWLDATRLLVAAKGKVAILTLADMKLTQAITVPDNVTAVSVAPTTTGYVIGTEGDGAVRLTRDITGKLDEGNAWKNVLPTRIVKQVIANGSLTAIAYWGGAVRLLRDGKVAASINLPQDSAQLAWSGNQLIAADSGGRIAGYTMK